MPAMVFIVNTYSWVLGTLGQLVTLEYFGGTYPYNPSIEVSC